MLHLFIFCLMIFQAHQNDDVVGLWRGTSLCTVKGSACHDEVVVYHITRSKTASSYDIQANKIVNGVEDEMGIITCTYDATNRILNSSDKNNNGKWSFTIHDGQMDGTLMYKGSLYRIVKVHRDEVKNKSWS